jgi:hypothetical protein
MAKGIWVFVEHLDGKIKKVAYEILAAGRKVADELGEELCAVLLGKGVADLAPSLGDYGADKVLVVENDTLENYTTDGYANVVADLIKENEPYAFLLGGLFLKNQVDSQNKTLNQTNPFPSIRLKLVLSKQDRAAALDVEPRTHVSRGQRGGHRYACGPHQIGQ